MTQTPKFKTLYTFEKRLDESAKLNNKYKDRVPIIIDVSESNTNELVFDKAKYLVPFDISVSQFLYIIRKRIKLAPETALFLFINNSLPAASSTMGSVYESSKDPDGFLYAMISLESTFG